ncbi:MAG: tRNA lysidine(34) synthetase TilS [Fuerstiella sp.]|nr:tRNA lysidine(34) synthetase TilS [Fuerstiella sp.]
MFLPSGLSVDVNISAEFLMSLKTGYADCGVFSVPHNGLLLAVSGGADSMALLHGTAQLWPDNTSGLVVAHVDHNLRGDQSRADAAFVETTVEELGLQFVLLSGDTVQEQQKSGGSTEEVARRIRYQMLQSSAHSADIEYVVCGHQSDDQAETILHNIIRGTGLRGLTGMCIRRQLNHRVQLIRPMLDITRSSIEEFLDDLDLKWRFDESNSSTRYTRNKIRNHLIPTLAREYNPQLTDSLLRLASHATEAENLSVQVANRCLDDVVLELQPGVCRLQRNKLALWPESVVRMALRLVWDQQMWPQQGMTRLHWNDLAQSVCQPDGRPSNCPGVEVSMTPKIVRIFRCEL